MTTDDLPAMRCPQCKAEHPDFDGFGFLAHTKPAYADGCGWCSHPSSDGDGNGNWVCGICGHVEAGVVRDPIAEAEFDEVWGLAAADARNGDDPRVLTGSLGHLQGEYEAKYAETLVEISAAKELN